MGSHRDRAIEGRDWLRQAWACSNCFHPSSDIFQDYLGPTFLENSSLKSSQLGNYGLFSVRFLHGSVAILDGLASEQLCPLLRALDVCCQCVVAQKDHIKLKEPLTVQKVLYHLVVKILNKVNVCWFYKDIGI